MDPASLKGRLPPPGASRRQKSAAYADFTTTILKPMNRPENKDDYVNHTPCAHSPISRFRSPAQTTLTHRSVRTKHLTKNAHTHTHTPTPAHMTAPRGPTGPSGRSGQQQGKIKLRPSRRLAARRLRQGGGRQTVRLPPVPEGLGLGGKANPAYRLLSLTPGLRYGRQVSWLGRDTSQHSGHWTGVYDETVMRKCPLRMNRLRTAPG